MDPAMPHVMCEDSSSHTARSTLQHSAVNLDLSSDSCQSLAFEPTQSSPSPHYHLATALLSPGRSAYLPTPGSQPYSILSPPGQHSLKEDWTQPSSVPDSTSSLRDSEEEYLLGSLNQPFTNKLTTTANMTATAIQFDPTFSMGPRSAFTWPGHMEHSPSNSSMLASDLASITSHGSEPSLTPPSVTRSITSSPPRLSFTPEQRELKKQRDRARQNAKLSTRLRRTSSNTSSYMDSPPPMPMQDATGAMNMPIYSTAPAPISLLTEPASSMAGQSYLPSYSPPMPDHAGTGPVFPTPYQQPLPSYGMPMEYPTSYPAPGDYSRPSSLPHDSGMMYQVPAVMTTGGTSAPEGGHVRVVQSRPKPRCWEHGCNGRQFSTFSNLLRHQREKSGQASKASCPNCGAEFTRTTARNGHLLHDKCKQRRSS